MKSNRLLVSLATFLLAVGAVVPVINRATSNVKAADINSQSKVPLVQNQGIGQGFYSPNQKLTMPNPMLRTDPTTFFNSIKQGAIDTWGKHNFLPSVTAAQAAIESGWGTSGLTAEANNLFGIKGRYNGQYVIYPTQEWINGHYVTINAEFRKYPNWATSVEDHGNFFTDNPRYHNLLGLTDYKQVANLVQQDGYATDPNYAATIIRVIEQYGLQEWDQEAFNNQGKGSLDKFKVDNGQLSIIGWSAANSSVGKQYSYLFAMDASTNKEIMRWKINRADRQDVEKAYPNIANSLHSGFNMSVDMPEQLMGKSIKLKARYTSDVNGDIDTSDYDFNNILSIPKQATKGSLDYFKQEGNNIHVIGWNIGMYTRNRKIRKLYVMDKETNKQLAVVGINSLTREDVAKAYPDFTNPGQSGFDVRVPITENMKGKNVFVISRYTSNVPGDDVDYWPSNQTIKIY